MHRHCSAPYGSMRQWSRFATALTVSAILVLGACERAPQPPSPPAERAAGASAPDAGAAPTNVGPRATEGDTMLVVATPVRADRRGDFEQFVEAFWSAGLRDDQRGFQHVRVLHPTDPNPDGTYTYFFIFDPMTPGGDPGLEPAVRRLFPAAEADRLLRQFEGALAGEQSAWRVVQSRF